MNSKEKMKYTSEKGITLIALVITIIVLLILAGVTISMVLGDDGIIGQAKQAEQEYGTASESELQDIGSASIKTELLIEGARGELTKSTFSKIENKIYITGMKVNELAKAGKLLKSIRQERREIKNTIERLELIQGFTTKCNNRMIQGDIIQLLKGLSTIEKRQSEPKYNCRTNILEELSTQDDKIQKQESDN